MKQKIACALMALALALAGCASSGRGQAERDPVALAALRSNNDIHWADEEKSVERDDSFLTGVLGIRLNTPENAAYVSYAENFIDEAESIVYGVINQTGIARFVEKDRVLGARAYREARIDRRFESRGYVSPRGYRPVSVKDKELAPALGEETEARSLMAVEFIFTKDMASGIGKSGKMRAQVSMTLTLTDASSGRTWYTRTLSAGSRDTIAVSSGGYNEEEFFGLLRTTVAELSARFVSLLETR
jgi:hypothetical protein